jgi:hypothetical protein
VVVVVAARVLVVDEGTTAWKGDGEVAQPVTRRARAAPMVASQADVDPVERRLGVSTRKRLEAGGWTFAYRRRSDATLPATYVEGLYRAPVDRRRSAMARERWP